MIQQLVVGPLQVNCYIVTDEQGNAVVVDPGGDGNRINSTIAAAGLTVHAVIDTHGHFDHIGANDTVARNFGLPVHIHEEDAPMLESPASRNPMFDQTEMDAGESPVVRLADDEVLAFGSLKMQVLHTPGHTRGGICLLVSSDGGEPKDLITGDTLFAGSIGRSDFPGGDQDTLMASIKDKILPLGDDVRIYPGHGGSSTIGDQKINNPYVMMLLGSSEA